MMATLAVAAALSLAPGQAGELRLTNERATYGSLGPIRKDTKLLAGDVFYLAFDIEGLNVSDTGEVYYRMSMAIKDSKGKDQFKQEPIEQRQLLSLGGTRVPASAHARIGTDTPPGEYTFEVTVSDPKSKRKASVERKLQVDNKGLGIIQLSLSYDPDGRLPLPTLAVPGLDCWVSFGVVGFQRDGKTKQPDLLAEMIVLDDKGKPTLPKPISGEVKEVPEKLQGVPLQFMLARNRAGRFTVQLKVTDRLAKKTVEQSFEINVIEPK